MDWNQTKSIADANVDAITGKVSSPRAALSALEKKITSEVEKIEAYLVSLDGRAMELPGLLDQADQKVAKIQAVVAKADNDKRADLKAAAMGRLAKEEGDRKALQDELDGLDNVQTTADEWLSKLQDKLMEVQAKSNLLPPDPKPAPGVAAPAPAPAPSAKAPAAKAPAAKAPDESDPADGPDLAGLDALVAAPKKAAPMPAPAPAKAASGAKAGGKKDELDDEFAALFADLNVDLSKVELPNKKKAPAIEVDDKIPDLVSVRDDELPDGEELPPLEMPKKGAPPPKGAAAAPAKGGAAPAPKAAAPAPVKGGAAAPAPAKAALAPAKATATPTAKASEPAKASSKAWLWWTAGIVTVGGAGAAALHFVWGVF
jgi:hypothetical protein